MDVQSINDYLYGLWEHGAPGQPNDALSKCLAEISSASVPYYSQEYHFLARFEPPKIEALCAGEVILFFYLKEVAWFKTRDFRR